MPTQPNTIPALPETPDRSDRNTFSARAENLFNQIKYAWQPALQAAADATYANALEAAASAASAAGATGSAGGGSGALPGDVLVTARSPDAMHTAGYVQPGGVLPKANYPGLFDAVGPISDAFVNPEGTFYVSGVDWHLVSCAKNALGDNITYALNYSNELLRSYNGFDSWQNVTSFVLPSGVTALFGIVSDGSKIFVIGNSPEAYGIQFTCLISADEGLTWSSTPIDASGGPAWGGDCSVAYGGNRIVLLVSYSNENSSPFPWLYPVVSIDHGMTWTRGSPLQLGTEGNNSEGSGTVIFDKDAFVVVNDNATAWLRSTDGFVWTPITPPPTFTPGINTIVKNANFSHGDYLAHFNDGTKKLSLSANDGLSWQVVDIPNQHNWCSVISGAGLLVLFGSVEGAVPPDSSIGGGGSDVIADLRKAAISYDAGQSWIILELNQYLGSSSMWWFCGDIFICILPNSSMLVTKVFSYNPNTSFYLPATGLPAPKGIFHEWIKA